MIANQKLSFWGINQSDCEKVIVNACSFLVSRSWSRSEKNIFFDVDIVIKTNRMWFSVVCTLIDSDIRYHSGQDLMWTHSDLLNIYQLYSIYIKKL